MMNEEVIIKKWGNSMGIVIPKELVEKQHLKENEKVMITIIKKADLSAIFGSFRGRIKKSAQEMKNIAREGWNP